MRVEAVAADAVGVDASLAMIGMFAHEWKGARLTGGLRHLDDELGGALVRLRATGIFTARLGETITLAAPMPPVRARTLLAMGLGDPGLWSPATMEDVLRRAVRVALELGVESAAFAPGLIDSGVPVDLIEGVPARMIAGVAGELRAGRPGGLRRWIFCSGESHLAASAAAMRLAFERHAGHGDADG